MGYLSYLINALVHARSDALFQQLGQKRPVEGVDRCMRRRQPSREACGTT
jgi:hypothetical protein